MGKSLCGKCTNETDDRFLRDCEECGRALCWTCYGEPRGEAWCRQCVDEDGKRMTVYDADAVPEHEPCPLCGKKAVAVEAGMVRIKEPKSKIPLFRWRCGEPDCGWISKQWGVVALDDNAKFKKNWDEKNKNGG